MGTIAAFQKVLDELNKQWQWIDTARANALAPAAVAALESAAGVADAFTVTNAGVAAKLQEDLDAATHRLSLGVLADVDCSKFSTFGQDLAVQSNVSDLVASHCADSAAGFLSLTADLGGTDAVQALLGKSAVESL